MSDIAIDLESFVRGVGPNITFIQDEVEDIDTEKRLAIAKEHTFNYDYAILAAGAQTNFFSFIKGLREHTHGIKDIQRAFAFRQAFEKRLADKLQNRTFKRAGDLHIAIAGAGLSGVEIAAEMAYTLKRYEKILAQCSHRLNISLIDAAPTILPGMHAYLIDKSRERLESLGVDIRTDAFISQIDTRTITFKDGTQLNFDFIIFTAGIKAAALIEKIDTPKNRMGQIIPDASLRVQGEERLFAVGDCTQITDEAGNLLPPTAQTAEKSAAYVASAIEKLEKNEAPSPFHTRIDGVFIALGGEYAAGMLYDKIKVSGYTAWLLKKAITRFYRFGLELKVNAGYKKRVLKV
jgi:NADH dehydrogenase